MKIDISEMICEVGRWSETNFGDQIYKPRENVAEFRQGRALGAAAPLLGMIEEKGEMEDAWENMERGEGTEDLEDAVGDICIYLCDFLYRDGVREFEEVELTRESDPSPVGGLLSRLCHAYLKHHQGIRDLAAEPVYEATRNAIVKDLLYSLHWLLIWRTEETLHSTLQKTWNEVVRKRDWKKDPAAGGGHTH